MDISSSQSRKLFISYTCISYIYNYLFRDCLVCRLSGDQSRFVSTKPPNSLKP